MRNEALTRRECLTRGAGAVLAAGAATAAGYLLYDPGSEAGSRAPHPSVDRLPNYLASVDLPASDPRISIAVGNAPDVKTLVRAAVDGLAPGLGMKRFITAGDVVLIKPNVGFDRPPYLGATTHPEVVRALIRLCLSAGARRVVITDNPIESATVCFARSRITEVAQAEGAHLWFPSSADFQTLVVRPGRCRPRRAEALGRWPLLLKPLREATKLIGAAPIKDHNLCSASMNLKNWYGLLGGARNRFHQVIHSLISDLAMIVSPTLVIADGTRVMMRNGPTGGRRSDVRPGGELGRPVIVASVDATACDAWCYERLLGRDPGRLAYLELARTKIRRLNVGGERRFGERDWRVYERERRIVTTTM